MSYLKSLRGWRQTPAPELPTMEKDAMRNYPAISRIHIFRRSELQHISTTTVSSDATVVTKHKVSKTTWKDSLISNALSFPFIVSLIFALWTAHLDPEGEFWKIYGPWLYTISGFRFLIAILLLSRPDIAFLKWRKTQKQNQKYEEQILHDTESGTVFVVGTGPENSTRPEFDAPDTEIFYTIDLTDPPLPPPNEQTQESSTKSSKSSYYQKWIRESNAWRFNHCIYFIYFVLVVVTIVGIFLNWPRKVFVGEDVGNEIIRDEELDWESAKDGRWLRGWELNFVILMAAFMGGWVEWG